MTLQQVKNEALALGPDERAQLVRALIHSLDEGSEITYEDDLNRELERRVREIEDGTALGRPALSALEEIRNELR